MAARRSTRFPFMRKLHKWLALAIGLQLLIWLCSGMLMSLIDQDIAAGNASRANPATKQPLSKFGTLYAPHLLTLAAPQIVQLSLDQLLDKPVYRIETAAQTLLYDATTGAEITIDAEFARNIARASYSGSGQPTEHKWLPQGTAAPGGIDGPLWEIKFSDALGTRVFVAAGDGRVIAHANDRSELMDFLLMLHFMDYLQHGSFNNPQIILFGFATLWLAISGLLLLSISFSQRDVTWLAGRRN